MTVTETRNEPRSWTDLNDDGLARTRTRNWKTPLLIGTWNVRSLYGTGCAMAVDRQLTMNKVDVVAVQEVRWPGQGEVKIQEYTLLYSGREDGVHRQGVGFFVHARVQSAMISFTPVNERIAKIRLRAKWFNVTLISCYAPYNNMEDNAKDDFYGKLQEVIDSTPRHDLIIVLGDLNAKVDRDTNAFGPSIGKESLHEDGNDNGYRLASFALQNNLIIGGTIFPHKDIHKHTWISPDGRTVNQIDHIMIGGKHRSAMENVRSMRGADCGTDHHLVIGKFKAKLKTRRQPRNTVKKFNTEKLKNDETRRQYEVEIRNRFDVLNLLMEENERSDVNTMLNNIVETIDKGAEETLGFSRRTRRNHWYDRECEMTATEARNVWLKWMKDKRNENLQQELRLKRRERKRILRQKKRQSLDAELDEIERQAQQGNVREHYKKLRQIKKGYQARSNMIRGRNGEVLTNEDDIVEEWEAFFKTLLNRPEPQNPIDSLDNVNERGNRNENEEEQVPIPTMGEVKEAIKHLKNNKSPGCDNIPAELIKCGGEMLATEIHKLIVAIWEEEKIPDMWELADIIAIHKKGSKLECDNYRGISLLCTLYKVLTRILLTRLQPLTETIIGEQQAGFRPGRSTTDQIFSLRIILEKYREYNKNLYQLFIDYRQAYDSIHRPSMWHIMEEYDIPKKLIRLIKACYNNSKCSVKVGTRKTNYFEVRSGLRQGCMLSPILFNLVLEKAIQTTTGRPHGARLVNNIVNNTVNMLAYADDVVILSETEAGLEDISTPFLEMGKRMGLECNQTKTKAMLLSRQDRIDGNMNIGELEVENVQTFKYLGSTITSDNVIDKEVAERIGSGNRCSFALNKVLSSGQISRKTKLRIYNVIIRPVVLYGCETWTLTEARKHKLEVFENSILRKILGPTYDNELDQWVRRHNRDLRRMTDQPFIQDVIRSRRVRWAGHCARMTDDRTPKVIMNGTVQGTRPVGRPRYRWVDNIRRDIQEVAPHVDDWQEEAQDRRRWRGLVTAVMGLQAREPHE